MRAIILAAGRGSRLQQAQLRPKCLLEFGGATLLERHLQLLRDAGVAEVVLVLGFMHETVAASLRDWHGPPLTQIVVNPRFELGSVVTLDSAAAALRRGGDVLVMDADVLYDERIMRSLVEGAAPVNRLLIDREFEPGAEPVKVCVRAGAPIELRKQLGADLACDTIGESVGFFRLSEAGAARLASIVAGYVEDGRADQPHEEALRDLLREASQVFEVADVTGMPWIEIDFPADVERARQEILPRLQVRPGAP
jgi:choline kinase